MEPAPLVGLSGTLHRQLTDWIDRRKPQEEEMLRAYQDNMRIPRDNDTAEVGTSKAQKSKLFIGSTRSKIRSARAKIKDSLFPAGNLPFDTEPANEKLKGFADTVEAILEHQLKEAGFKKTLSTGVDSICTYGTGFIFGPFVKEKTHTVVDSTEQEGVPTIAETELRYDCPYYEHARTMDTYPDPEAEDVREGMGVFWCSRKSPEFIRSLKDTKGYNNQALDRALVEKVTAYTDQGSDRTDAARMNLYRYTKEGRIWFTRYFGLVKRSELAQWQDGAATDDQERVEAIVIMAGGQVVKADENPYKDHKRPARRCVYEDVEHEMWGVGIAKNNDPNQRVINAAFRLYIEGKAFALLKMCSIDRSKFEVSEDFKAFPGKRYLMKPGLTPEERKSAIIWHDTEDVTEGWEKVIAMSETFSDDDTAITKYTQGTDAPHLNDTATGISMIMNASSLPLKEVLGNIDEMWIESMIEDQMDWNMEHLEPATVQALLSDEHAKNWAAVKKYGKTNFMKWYATGSSTFMAKEVLMHKLQGFLQIVAANEHLGQFVDMRELLEQVWDAGQIGKESPVMDEETIQKNAANPANQAAMQHIQELEQKAGDLIKKANERADAAEAKATQAQAMEQFKRDELAAKDKQAERDTLLKMAEAGRAATLAGAQIDKLQADTVASLRAANEQPDAELEAAAVSKEPVKGAETAPAAPDHMAVLAQALHRMTLPKRAVITRQPDGSLVGELSHVEQPAEVQAEAPMDEAQPEVAA